MRKLLFVSLLFVAACDRESSSKNAPLPSFDASETKAAGPPSEFYEDPDFHAEVLGSRPCDPGPPFLPAPGMRRLLVKLRVTSRSPRPVPVSPLAFQLEDKEGHRFGATLAGCGEPMESVRLEKDSSIEGEVAFDVPKPSSALRLVYEPFLIGRAKVSAVLIVPDAAN